MCVPVCLCTHARKLVLGVRGWWFVCVCTHKDTGQGVGWFVCVCKYTHVRTLVLGVGVWFYH